MWKKVKFGSSQVKDVISVNLSYTHSFVSVLYFCTQNFVYVNKNFKSDWYLSLKD